MAKKLMKTISKDLKTGCEKSKDKKDKIPSIEKVDTSCDVVQKPRIGVVTTFPNWATEVYGKKFIESFCKHFPDDVFLFLALDPDEKQRETISAIEPILQDRLKAGTCLTACNFTKEQIEFLKRNHSEKSVKDYRFDYKRFSYKVFALCKALEEAREEKLDYLIWMDADIVINKDVTHEDILRWMPAGEQAVSYLGRKDWDHSECGFIGFDLSDRNAVLVLDRILQMYCTDEVLTLEQWHDSFVFDTIWKEMPKKNLSEGVDGRDVFDRSLLGTHMTHNKGNLKFKTIKDIPVLSRADNSFDPNNPTIGSLPIKTKNCVDHEIILDHISRNLRQITDWVDYCPVNDEEIAICSGGESFNPYEAKSLFQDKGIKILAVKHVLKKFLDIGVVPWGCILLDPREHVKDFLHNVPKEVVFFVASMVDPDAIKMLIENGNMVIGYHAIVNAGEDKLIPRKHYMTAGGSATSTRGIDVMQLLGFRNFHLYAYDLSANKKPDLTLRKKGGKLIWEEITLTEMSYGGYPMTRTFWTKGEFLAQVQELQKMYLPQRSITFKIYGDGIVPWMHKHMQLYKQWQDDLSKMKLDDLNRFAKNVNEWLNDKRERSSETDSQRTQYRVGQSSGKIG